MIARPARWGVLFALLAVALAAGLAVVAVAAGPMPRPTLTRTVLPAVAAALGIVVLFAGHLSYPRVQNLRVYLAGYLVGLQSLLYALFIGFAGWFTDAVPLPPAGYGELVLLVALLGALAYTLVPAFPTYRTTRVVTWTAVVAQVALLSAARFFPAAFGFLGALEPPALVSWQHAAPLALAIAIVALNAALRPEGFYLQGTFTGLAILAVFAFVSPALIDVAGYGPVSVHLVRLLYAAVTPLFLVTAFLFHVLARLGHRVSYDPLLHVYNRQHCDQILAGQSGIPTRPPIAVLMIDIDHFKQVNDTYGHQAGDRVLFGVAQAVQKAVVPQGVVCRYGGEELIVFFPGLSGRDVVPLARRLVAHIEQMETSFRGTRISVTVSIGISDRRSARVPLAHVVYAADKALYLAKENGRNQVRFVRIKEPPRPAASARTPEPSPLRPPKPRRAN